MGAFSPVPAIGWNALTFWRDELQRAIRERHLAYFAAGVDWDDEGYGLWGTIKTKGNEMQRLDNAANLLTMQQFFDYFADGSGYSYPFVDHTQGGGDFSGLTDFPVFDRESFCTAAGLTYVSDDDSIGWKASTIHPGDPAFSDYEYRPHGSGDIIGAWCLEEIQKAAVALKWTLPPITITDLGGGDYTVEPTLDWLGLGATPTMSYTFDVYELSGGVLSLYAADATSPVAYTTETIAGVVLKFVFTHDALP